MNQLIKTQNKVGKTMNILCATDEKYAPYCGVMLTSFLENHKGFHTEVYIVVKSRLKAEKKLKKLENWYDVKVNIMEFPFTDTVSSYPIDVTRWSIETYFRIFAAEILPEKLDRILYLDCDIIVDGDVSELFAMNLDGISALVADDMPWNMTTSHFKRLGYTEEYRYFNAGMMMINLEYWREHYISTQCVNIIKTHLSKLDYCDQDVLNIVLKDSKKNISIIYNFQESVVLKEFYELYDDGLKKEICSRKPKIIHYATCIKPWLLYAYGMPFYALWQRYKRRSMWWYLTDKLPKEKPFNYFIKRYFLWPFGIMRIKYEVAEEWKRSNEKPSHLKRIIK